MGTDKEIDISNLTDEQIKRTLDFIGMSDLEFYEKYIYNLPLEEQAAFMKEFPDIQEK